MLDQKKLLIKKTTHENLFNKSDNLGMKKNFDRKNLKKRKKQLNKYL